MNKELMNFLRNQLKNHKEYLLTVINEVEKHNHKLYEDIYHAQDNGIFIFTFGGKGYRFSKKEMIAKYEESKKLVVIIENLENVLLNHSTDKVLDWRYLIFLLEVIDHSTLSNMLFAQIIAIIKKDILDYCVFNTEFRKMERNLSNLITEDNRIVEPDLFAKRLTDLMLLYAGEYPYTYVLHRLKAVLKDDYTLVIACREYANHKTEEETYQTFTFQEKESPKKLEIKDVLDEEYKKFSYSFTTIAAVDHFIDYLKQITNDELLLSIYRKKALLKYNRFIESKKEELLSEVYQEDYEVISLAKNLNVTEIHDFIQEIYAMADMWLSSNEEDKQFLLKEFHRYMIHLKDLYHEYMTKEEENIAEVIYYPYQNEVVVYEQLLSVRKEFYLDYYKNIYKIIHNHLRNFELLGSNYPEPVYYLGKEQKVFYTFVNEIPIIICIGTFHDALKIVNAKEFKSFIDDVKKNLLLYLTENEDHDRVIHLLSKSSRVVRKLKENKNE